MNTNQPSNDKENKGSLRGGSFFKKKARRAKSLNKDHWQDVVFGKLGYECLVFTYFQNLFMEKVDKLIKIFI